jgi:hypothetical protein
MAYIYPAPGASSVTLTIQNAADTTNDDLSVTGLQDMTINASNDIFSWEQLDTGSKFQIATTATNSVAMNLVVDKTKFFGADPDSSTTTDTASNLGIFGLSRLKSSVEFTISMGPEDSGSGSAVVTGTGYITGLAPTVSAGEPVWVTPITITVTGDYAVTTT